jgi:hypothetical protein
MKCLVNHANAWRIARDRSRPTVVVEADFVPVKGFGGLPLPCPADRRGKSLPYLYACGAELWDTEAEFARGHAGSTVAYVVWPAVARLLLTFYEQQLEINPSGAYSTFDTQMGYWLKDRGVESFFPLKQYGEHGGLPNPEHRRAGPSRTHRADALQAPLSFLPAYAEGSHARAGWTRLVARAFGWARFLTGRLVPPRDLVRNRLRTTLFAVRRLL